MQPALQDLEIDTTIFRPASFVELAIENLSQALTLGILLVAIVLVFFLFQWRTAIISLVAIPLSLVAAAFVLHLRGETTNTMVLAGLVIAVGVVVDDAIIDVENIVRRLREHRAAGGTRSTASIVLEASLEVRSPIVYATLIILAAAVPVFFLTGLMGSFFQPLALSYTLAVAASMLVAVTVTPAMALILLRRATLRAEPPRHVRGLQGGYTRLLRRTVRRPLAAYAVVAALVVGGAAVVPRLGQDLLPTFRERDFLMHWVLEPSASYDETMAVTKAASRELRQVPGVRNFGAHVGQAAMGDEVYGIYFVENWISIDPEQDYDATLDRVQTVVDGYPGLRRDVQTYLKERIREVLTGAGEAVVVRVFGDDLDVIEDKAHEIEDAIATIPGVKDPHTDLQTRIPHLVVQVDLDKAQALGLKPGDVRRQAAVYLAAQELSDVFRNGKAYDVMVWSVPESRRTPDHVRDLLIDTPAGGTVRLADIATVEMSSTPSMIRRIDGSRRLDVGANVEGRALADVAADVRAAVANVELPLGYRDRGHRRGHRAHGGLAAAAAAVRGRARDDPRPALRLVPALEARRPEPAHAPHGARRRGPRRLADQWHHDDRVLRRPLHGARDRGSQRHPHDQPLPAPRGGRGRHLRARPRHPGGPGAPGADPHDDARDRPGPGAPRRHGRRARSRDRVPHGHRHPRGPPDLHAAQPVRRALALPEVRPGPGGAGRGDADRPADVAAGAAARHDLTGQVTNQPWQFRHAPRGPPSSTVLERVERHDPGAR